MTSDSAESPKETVRATSEMTPMDWNDIAESEFVDFIESARGTNIGFVFEHPELGLHGFRFFEDSAHIEPCSFEER